MTIAREVVYAAPDANQKRSVRLDAQGQAHPIPRSSLEDSRGHLHVVQGFITPGIPAEALAASKHF